MHISRRLLATVGLCLISLLPNAAVSQSSPVTAKLPLWVAKGKNSTVYFLGSIHFLKQDFYPLPATIESAYTNADVVVFETEIEKMRNPAVAQKIMSEGIYPPGKTIADDISEENYRLLQETLRKKLGQANVFDRFKPYLVGLTLSMLEIQRLGFRPEDGVDQYISRKATRDKKEIRALETLDEQMSFFTGMTKEEQEALLVASLEDMNQIEKIFGEIVAAWKEGDSKKLDALVKDAMKDHPKLTEKLFTNRNRKWITEIEPLLQGDKDVLVVVGVGHLVGEDSVIELLQKKGIKVEQVTAAP